ncbi:MAG TPA: DUF6452 family protein [Paludibacteraceae bacterium]|nr:DUF6452 family protein [Paludibacteraceae bacterium]HPT43698.1 DUF6452 family protein [Paludibacteraceae bacterium]
MKKLYFWLLPVLLLTSGLISCNNDETCRKSKTVLMGAKFYQDTLNLKTNQYVTINFKADSLTASGVNNDSIIYKKVTNLSEIKLPVDKLKTQSRFSIKFNEVYDTITVLYHNTDEYLSLECGCVRTHTIDTVLTTNHIIEKIKIIQPIINTTYVENIKIYLAE